MYSSGSLIDFAILSFWSLFAIVDPITTVPTFIAMTERDTVQQKIRMVRIASVVTFLVLFVFSLCGQFILDIFGISVPAFQVAGGIVLLIVALDMLRARRTAIKETPEEQAEGTNKEDIAVTPLAIPMLAGPGAITAVVLLRAQAFTWGHQLVVIGNICLVSMLTFLILHFAALKSAFLSGITLKIVSRLMGLLLAAIAVQFILTGVGIF